MSLPKYDLHSHYLPSFYRDALLEAGHEHPDGMPAPPQWSEAEHVTMMSSLNIHKSILSISSPGTHLTPGRDEEARNLTRRCNEFAADLKRRRPNHLGFFASLPMPDVDGTLAEIAYAQDKLNADGYVMMTNHHGFYPGDKKFDAVFDELNRRKAIVFIHPTTPCTALPGGGCSHAAPLEAQYPRPMFEFFFDTARAYINLFLTGTISRCPNITFVVTHASGALPPLVNRFASVPALLKLPGIDMKVSPAYVREKLNSEQFFFDTAGWVFPDQIKGLLAYLDDSGKSKRIIYGSDYPWTPLSGVKPLSDAHDQYVTKFFPGGENDVGTGNAKRLLALKGRQE